MIVTESKVGAEQAGEAGRSKRPANTALWTVFGVLLGLALLYAATRRVEWPALIATLKDADWRWSLGILAVTVTFIAIKAWRWKILLRFVPVVRFRDLHAAVYIGLAANFLLSHVGEFIRTTIVTRKTRAAFSAVLASVLIERLLDFVALLALLALFALLAQNVPDVVSLAGAVTAAFVVVAIAAVYLFLHPPRWLAGAAASLGDALPATARHWLAEQLARSREGLESIKDLPLMGMTMAISVLQWSLVVLAVWLSAAAVGHSVSVVGAAITFVVIVVGLTLPNSPMQIGTTQFAFTLGMGADGTPASAAFAASIVYTALLILPIMIIGGGLTMRGRALRETRVD